MSLHEPPLQHETQASSSPPPLDKPSYEDINTPVVVMVGVISALLTLLSMMFFQGLYYHWESWVGQDADAARSQANRTVEHQRSLLKGQDGLKSIDEAMQSVVSRYQK
jgi:hypothetical protein